MKPQPHLPRVQQFQVDPCGRLPRDLRRAATAILNSLRQPDPFPLLLPIGQAYAVAIALDAARTQNLLILRQVEYE
jgi:hypothetical protein